ncbi:MAG: ECF transporter S component [Coriobacteriia bacterium]|nr:ECF transporter S component [Coriobacteriia bacterium]
MTLLLSSIVVGIPLIVLALTLERTKPRPRDLMPVVVLSALAIVGRVVAMPIPNFQPATALIVLTGFFFGRRAGLLSGMFVALISNMLMGQGPWTPWQMLAWSLVGYGAGFLGERISWGKAVIADKHKNTDIVKGEYGTDISDTSGKTDTRNNLQTKHRASRGITILFAVTVIYGAVASLIFGVIMDTQFFVAYAWESGWSGLIAALAMGLPFNMAHAASTLIFLALTLIPWGKKFHRLKTKYGIQSM